MRAFDKRPCPACDICGRMVSFKEAENPEKFLYRMITPDSDVSTESWEMYHVSCWQKEHNEIKGGGKCD